MKLRGRVAIVTGSASGIGKAIVTKFMEAEAGGVVIADLNKKAAEKTAKEFMNKYEGKALAIQTDVAKQESVHEMVNTVMNKFGHIDILVNNAGICPVTSWDQTTLEDWNHILEVNLTGMFVCTKAVIPIMRKQKYGRIVYISSAAANVGSLVAHVAYGVSKAGILALMKSVAKEVGAYGITANAVSPGTINTPMTESFGSKIKESFIENCILKRQGDPGEVADAVLYLVSDRAAYVTGHTLNVDGGFALR